MKALLLFVLALAVTIYSQPFNASIACAEFVTEANKFYNNATEGDISVQWWGCECGNCTLSGCLETVGISVPTGCYTFVQEEEFIWYEEYTFRSFWFDGDLLDCYMYVAPDCSGFVDGDNSDDDWGDYNTVGGLHTSEVFVYPVGNYVLVFPQSPPELMNWTIGISVLADANFGQPSTDFCPHPYTYVGGCFAATQLAGSCSLSVSADDSGFYSYCPESWEGGCSNDPFDRTHENATVYNVETACGYSVNIPYSKDDITNSYCCSWGFIYATESSTGVSFAESVDFLLESSAFLFGDNVIEDLPLLCGAVTLSFDEDHVHVNETEGTITLTVNVDFADIPSFITSMVLYASTIDGSAVAGQDFEGLDKYEIEINVVAGHIDITVPIRIIDNGEVTGDLNFTVSITSDFLEVNGIDIEVIISNSDVETTEGTSVDGTDVSVSDTTEATGTDATGTDSTQDNGISKVIFGLIMLIFAAMM